MRLVDASRFFDRTEVFDADTGVLLFRAQIKNYDESRRDNATAYRRVMSVAPGLDLPVNNVVRALGDAWLVGDRQQDGQKELHREKYVLQRAPAKADLYTLAGYLSGVVKAQVWADLHWLADRKELDESSDTPQYYTVFTSDASPPVMHDVVVFQGRSVLVQASARTGAGITESRGFLQPQITPFAVVVNKRQYSPAAGQHTATASEAVNGLLTRWQELYRYADQLDERYRSGDKALALPLATDVGTADTITVGGKTWAVLEVAPLSGCKVLHLRPQ